MSTLAKSPSRTWQTAAMAADPISTTLDQALTDLTARLASLPEARREAEALACAALGISRTTLIVEGRRQVTPTERARLTAWAERRAAGEPLAYLTGKREFWSMTLQVSPAVLVPRPETELLIERALTLGDAAAPLKVLDLGTGSGAIALALARERPAWRIIATDRSAEALELARQNAEQLGIGTVSFLQGDWFDALPTTNIIERVDLAISNPPYVAADDPVLTGDSLRFEPRGALTPGLDALSDLYRLIDTAPRYLARHGWLLLEHGSTQATAVRARLVARGFTHVVSHRDLAGHERMTEGRWTDTARN